MAVFIHGGHMEDTLPVYQEPMKGSCSVLSVLTNEILKVGHNSQERTEKFSLKLASNLSYTMWDEFRKTISFRH